MLAGFLCIGSYDIKINKLHPYPTLNFLGNVSDTINWQGCIEHIPQFSAACYIMRSVKPCMSLNTLKVVYYSQCNSVVINYGLPLCGNSTHSVQIFRMQNNIVRIMLGCKRRVSCRNLVMKLKILLLASQYIFFLIHSLSKSKNQFTLNSDIYNINTRQHCNFHQHISYVTKYIKRKIIIQD